VVNTALSNIADSMGGGVAGSQWIVGGYTTAFAALFLTAGALGDRIGAKHVFMAGFTIFTMASAACALSPTIWALIAARVAQGAGAAILVPNSLALLNHAYPDDKDHRRARHLGGGRKRRVDRRTAHRRRACDPDRLAEYLSL
jgi:MFS transporter, DHA2 family, methylenomycin A resistance protein